MERGGSRGRCRAAGHGESFLHRPDSGAGHQMFHDGYFPFLGNSASALSPARKTSGHFCPFHNTTLIWSTNAAASASGCTGSSVGHVAPSPTTAVALCFQDVSPGYCWPLQASQRQVLIRLPATVRPTAVSVQHLLKKSSALGDISSAPRDFTVFVSLCWAPGAGEKLSGGLASLCAAAEIRVLALPCPEAACQGTCQGGIIPS